MMNLKNLGLETLKAKRDDLLYRIKRDCELVEEYEKAITNLIMKDGKTTRDVRTTDKKSGK